MSTHLSKTVTLLLAFWIGMVMAGQGTFAVSAGVVAGSAPAKCQCRCGELGKCSMPACCSAPVDGRAPVTPAPPSSTSQNEWQALAASFLFLAALPPPAAQDSPVRTSLSASISVVPIFQRDCCYLL
jgi:hypothetical protein